MITDELPEELVSSAKMLAVAVLVGAVGWFGVKGLKAHAAAKRDASVTALANAYTAQELEDAVAKYGSKEIGGALKLRLAKSYYDAGNFQAAYDQYAALEGKAPDGFADLPVVGKAQALEGLGKFDAAFAAFDGFAAANAKSPLALTAKLGAARCLAQKGEKDKALARLAELKTSVKGDGLAEARVETTEDVVKRYVK